MAAILDPSSEPQNRVDVPICATRAVATIFQQDGWGHVNYEYEWEGRVCRCRLEEPHPDIPSKAQEIVGVGATYRQATRDLAEQLLPLLPPLEPRVLMRSAFRPPEICVIRSEEDFCAMLHEAKESGFVALDSECIEVRPPLLVQVATSCRVYVFIARDRKGVRDGRLAQLLSDRRIVKVIFGNDEWRVLKSIAPVWNWVNVQRYSTEMGLMARRAPYGLVDFASKMKGVALDKDKGCAQAFGALGTLACSEAGQDAEAVRASLMQVSRRQISYAAADAWVTKALYEHLQNIGVDVKPGPIAPPAVLSTELYPHVQPDGNDVTFENCMTIFCEYYNKTMKLSVDIEKVLFKLKETAPCAKPTPICRKLVEVGYPSPDGDQVVTLSDVEEYWGGLAMDDVMPRNALPAYEKEKRWFIFVVVVQMVKLGYLDRNNRPTERAVSDTSAVCHAARARALTLLAPNWKGLLCRWLRERDPEVVVQFQVESLSAQRFRASLEIKTSDGGTQRFQGRIFNRKKLAEQEAAREALEALQAEQASDRGPDESDQDDV